MRRKQTTRLSGMLAGIALLACGAAAAELPVDCGGAAYTRETVYEFAVTPSIARVDGGWQITFTSKAACDATIAVVNKSGKVLRHLVSGVLGPNAPEPLQKGSLAQKILWDGRDDFGKPITDSEGCRVRISLGLSPEIEKPLFWHPGRFFGPVSNLAATKEGVVVVEGNIYLFSAEGRYIRTLSPSPSNALSLETAHAADVFALRLNDDVAPIRTELPDGRKIVSPNPKTGRYHPPLEEGSVICSGDRLLGLARSPSTRIFGLGLDSRIVAAQQLPRLGGARTMGAAALAVSPDQKWLYFTSSATPRYGHAVYRAEFSNSADVPKIFAGQTTVSKEPGGFNLPLGLATDSKGRLYVADFGNSRVQIFSDGGKHEGTIEVESPRRVQVDAKSGGIYVLSCAPSKTEFKLCKFSESLQALGEQVFQMPKRARRTAEPVFCLAPNGADTLLWISGDQLNLQIWKDTGNSFVLVKDFQKDLLAEYPGQADVEGQFYDYMGTRPVRTGGKPIVDYDEPYVYLGQPNTQRSFGSFQESGFSVRINVDTGKLEKSFPMYCFGWDGTPYGRQIKKDLGFYGIDRKTSKPVLHPCADIRNTYSHGGNGQMRYPLSVMADGSVLMHYGGDVDWFTEGEPYPGRMFKSSGWVMKFDKDGKLITKDLLQGIPLVGAGIQSDAQGNVYVVLPLVKMVDGKECGVNAVMKFPPGGGRFIVDGKGVPVPLEKAPDRPADFKPRLMVEADEGKVVPNPYGSNMWAEGMLWSNAAVFTPVWGHHCHCTKGYFDLDRYGRSFLPEAHRASVSVLDTNGNFILRLGEYGNVDDPLDKIRIACCRNVGVNDSHLYVDDDGNRRLLKVRLKYACEKELMLADK